MRPMSPRRDSRDEKATGACSFTLLASARAPSPPVPGEHFYYGHSTLAKSGYNELQPVERLPRQQRTSSEMRDSMLLARKYERDASSRSSSTAARIAQRRKERMERRQVELEAFFVSQRTSSRSSTDSGGSTPTCSRPGSPYMLLDAESKYGQMLAALAPALRPD